MPFDVQRLVSLRRVTNLAVSPDGSWAAVAVQRLDEKGARYTSDLYRVPLDKGDPERLTDTDAKDSSPRFRADGTLLFLSNRGEEEGADQRSQVHAWSPTGISRITDEPLGVESFEVAGDGIVAMVALDPDVPFGQQRARANERAEQGPSALHYKGFPLRHWDHWLGPAVARPVLHRGADRRDLDPDLREHAYGLDGAHMAVSPDGRKLAIVRSRRSATDGLYEDTLVLIDLRQGSTLASHAFARGEVDRPRFSPDGLELAFTRATRQDGQVPRPVLCVLTLATGAVRELCTAWDRWPQLHAWGPDGLLLSTSDDGAEPVFLVRPDGTGLTRLTSRASAGTHAELGFAARGVVGIRHGTLQPPEVFRCALGQESEPVVITSLAGITRQELEAMVEIEETRTPSTDGAPIHSWTVLPRGAERVPAVLWIHGGPVAAWGDTWHWRWNAAVFASQGVAVAMPNPRGSKGYGTPFVQGIWGNTWGAQCYADVLAVADSLAAHPWIDGDRMAAMGGSFGGYMSNWIGTQTDRFRCIVTHASVWHQSAFHGTTDNPRWWAWQMGVSPIEDLERAELYSPSRHARNWRTPTLVIHGEKDYRCPISEGLSLFTALDSVGVDAELLVFPDEGHWILKPKNIVRWYETVGDYLRRKLVSPIP